MTKEYQLSISGTESVMGEDVRSTHPEFAAALFFGLAQAYGKRNVRVKIVDLDHPPQDPDDTPPFIKCEKFEEAVNRLGYKSWP